VSLDGQLSQGSLEATKTPTECLAAVRSRVAKAQRDAAAAPPSISAVSGIVGAQKGLAAQCTARFDLATAAPADLASLVELYNMAGQYDRLQAAVTRALTAPNLAGRDRATVLLAAVQAGLADPPGAERDARLEGFVAQLDRLPAASAINQQFTAHQRMRVSYDTDGQPDGAAKHATWSIEAAKRISGTQRSDNKSPIVGAYLNLARIWASRGETTRAIALLKRVSTDLPEIPTAVKSVKGDLERLQLVGKPAAPLAASRWLNVPTGTKTLDLKGQVTLLEFSAHWCIPCKETYPALVRLRDKYGPAGFRVVLATEMYGFYEKETNITGDAEFARDREYFAATHLNAPVAVADGVHSPDENPNQVNYKVDGLPQIVLVDRRGVIRLMMGGYDKSSEATLTRQIDALVKEK
jgi:thiol-disulfide isomerase/thioredoxin